MSIAFFYNDSTDCVLAVENRNGGQTYIMFQNTSSLVRYCRENNINATAKLVEE